MNTRYRLIYLLLTAIAQYPPPGLTDESVGLCLSMGNAKLADFAETTMALVNYYDADRTRTVFLLSYEHASI